jgi:DNA-binding NtrC family response regulator
MATALIVDDEALPRDVLAGWVRAHGLDARTAPDAASALVLMQDSEPDVAVVDVRMPGPDGMWLADQIRQHFPHTAVVMCTGMLDLDSALWCLRDEVFGYLVKPFSRMEFERTIDRALDWHRDALGGADLN